MWTSLSGVRKFTKHYHIITEKAENFKYFAPFLEKITRFSLGITLWTNCGKNKLSTTGFFHKTKSGTGKTETPDGRKGLSTNLSTLWIK